MRVLLIQPDQNRSLAFQQLARVEALGLEMIAGALGNQHEVALLDLRMQPEGLSPLLADYRPQLVGISSTFTVDFHQALQAAQTAKEADPRTFVLIGGHHPSLRPADFDHPAVDAVAVGEGELTVGELAACLAEGGDPAQVPGLVLNRGGGQQATPARPLLNDLDRLPYPNRALTGPYRRNYYLMLTWPVATLETTRGCPYRCNFCSVWRFYQKRVRFKTPLRVVQELETVAEQDVFFSDDNFLISAPRCKEIARLIRERGIRKRYMIEARSDAIVKHPEVIEEWRAIGLGGIVIGFEKPDESGLASVNKHNSVANNERALEIVRRCGIEPTTTFIVDPNSGVDDFARLREYVKRLKLRLPAFGILTPLPGTSLYEEAREQLVTDDYRLFDLGHAVLRTRLPALQFYREYAALWREAYPVWELGLFALYMFLRQGIGDPERVHWEKVLAQGMRVRSASTYLQNWARAQVSLQEPAA